MMNPFRKTTLFVFTLSVLNTNIGMSHGDIPIFTKIQPAIPQEENAKSEVEYMRNESVESEKVLEKENRPIEQEKSDSKAIGCAADSTKTRINERL